MMLETEAAAGRWLVVPRARQRVSVRLFCFPYSGGSAFAFRTWPDYLPPDVEVCAVQLPGRENRLREPPARRVAPLVDALFDSLVEQLDVPCALFGHSLGALLAFEV